MCRDRFLSNSDRPNSTMDKQARQAIEELLVEFKDIFARHVFKIVIKIDFIGKLTPIDEESPIT